MSSHSEAIVERFTGQAASLSHAASITDERARALLVRAARPSREDAVLDVSCGLSVATVPG